MKKTMLPAKYLFFRTMRLRRSLVSRYRKLLAEAAGRETEPWEDEFTEGFYSVEKLLSAALKELEDRGGRLLRGELGEPRVLSAARRAAKDGADEDSVRRELSACPLTVAELELFPHALLIAELIALDERVKDPKGPGSVRAMLAELKASSELPWDKLLSELSPVERILSRDSGFVRLDKASRAVCVKETQRLAKRLDIEETAVAERACELARGGEGKRSHAAYFLASDGRDELIGSLAGKDAGLPMKPKTAFLLFLTAFLTLAAALSAAFSKRGAAAVLLAVFPAMTISLSTVTSLFSFCFKPRRILRLEVDNASGDLKTAVAVPVLLTDPDSAREAVSRLETHYLANPLEGASFILLGDLPDAKGPIMPGDAETEAAAVKGIDELNERYGERFGFLMRGRERNHDGVYQGRERKRGAVTELCRLLAGDGNGFSICHPKDRLSARYLVVLDADTIMPNGALAKLIGAAAHPVNAPEIRGGRAARGYSVFAPRMRTTSRSAAKSFFTRLISFDTGSELYSPAVSNLHMDAYREGDFGGKGIIDVRAFLELTEGRIPENTVLSHDLLEGSFARTAFLDDVVLYDGEPPTLPKWWKRQERWIRGDWQLIPFIFGRYGKGLSAIHRAKMLGNLMRSLREPITLAILAAAIAFGQAPAAVFALTGFVFEPIKGFVLLAAASLRERAAQDRWLLCVLRAGFELVTLPYSAAMSIAAISSALFRTLVSHRKMLLWQTAASSRGGENAIGVMNACGVFALAAASALSASRYGAGASVILGLVIASLWAFAVPAVFAADREYRRDELNESGAASVMRMFLRGFVFFDSFCTEKTNFLPPDSIQEFPEKPMRNVTSPTNIAMAIMAYISAHDLSVYDDGEFLSRSSEILGTISRLEKWKGIPYNWYRPTDLAVIYPRFVSSVDAGNLSAALFTLSAALKEIGAVYEAGVAGSLADEMELASLYDGRKKLFHIGFDADSGELTPAHYDLYASEARLLSYIAVVKGDVPAEHWSALSRIMRDAAGGRTLLSWSGTMFEYLMPLIFFETVPGSLQHEIALSAVRTQILRSRSDLPWGSSESGYYAFDRDENYQYRAFGERSLSLGQRETEHFVAAPYASALALYLEPEEALKNLELFREIGAYGRYGFFEAVDCGAGGSPRVVRSCMAHHKGMELCAYAALLTGNRNAARFMSIPRVRAFEDLLFEDLPLKPIVIRAYESSVYRAPKKTGERKDSPRKAEKGTLDGVLLSNGSFGVMIFTDGASVTKYGKILLAEDTSVSAFSGEMPVSLYSEAVFEPHRAEFKGSAGEISSRLSVCAAAFRNAEIRELTFVNRGDEDKPICAAVCFRPVLVREAEFRSHPAFVRLSIEAEEAEGAVLFHLRKKRGRRELFAYAALYSGQDAKIAYSTDAFLFPGRSRTYPEALALGERGEFARDPNEPCFAALAESCVRPAESLRLEFILGASETRDGALTELRELRRLGEREELARAVSEGMLRECGISAREAMDSEPPLARIARGAAFKPAGANRACGGVRALWELGVSGDRPIIAVRAGSKEELAYLRRFARFVRYARARGAEFDAVIISGFPTAYGDPDRAALSDVFRGLDNAVVIDRALVSKDALDALSGAALILADAGGIHYQPLRLGRANTETEGVFERRRKRRLELENGFGGFDTERNEYVIHAGERPTPAPWSNVLANESFGTLVTETGGGYTFCGNSRLMRLTPWSCDPISDPAPEKVSAHMDGKLYPLMPYGRRGGHEVSHGFGYTVSRCAFEGIDAVLTLFADSVRPVKYFMTVLTNGSLSPRRIKLTLGVEWALGEAAHPESLIFSEVPGIRFVSSARNAEEGRTAFITGEYFENDSAVFDVDLGPGQTAKRVFLLGMDSPETIREYSEALSRPENAEAELERVGEIWKGRLSAMEVRTDSREFDALFNGRLLYQTYSSRLFAKTGFYQSGGAVGFRDRLQDSLALLITDPERARRIILDSSSMQFKEGDVLHWRHEGGAGVRTRISDDRLFLPLAAAEYAETTGDAGIWDEETPFLEGEPLKDFERDRFEVFRTGDEKASLFEHCVRAIRASMCVGKNGIPLMGTGDWNDGFDEVGGESCMCGWLLLYVLGRFAPVCASRGEDGLAAELAAFSAALRESMENTWDGDRYLRAIRDDGTKLGSKNSPECSIDLISAVFAVFCGANHAEEAFDTAFSLLYDGKNNLIKLLAPPFGGGSDRPAGYVEAYRKGVRENGGQYTHAAAWAVIAACMLDKPETAMLLFNAANPILHGSASNAIRYAAEPYAVAADICGFGENAGRGGWTWYTGSAAWLFRAAAVHILGIKKTGDLLSIEPVTVLDSFELEYRFGSSVYHIRAERGEVPSMTADGKACEKALLKDDGGSHEIIKRYR